MSNQKVRAAYSLLCCSLILKKMGNSRNCSFCSKGPYSCVHNKRNLYSQVRWFSFIKNLKKTEFLHNNAPAVICVKLHFKPWLSLYDCKADRARERPSITLASVAFWSTSKTLSTKAMEVNNYDILATLPQGHTMPHVVGSDHLWAFSLLSWYCARLLFKNRPTDGQQFR